MNVYKLPKGEIQKVVYTDKEKNDIFVSSHKLLGNHVLYKIGSDKKLTKVTTSDNPLEFDEIVFEK